MKAIVLAGGMGTRLQSVVKDLPKPMAPIGEKPFLHYLLSYLHEMGVSEVVLSVHYLKEKIQDYFQSNFLGMHIHYVDEDVPLGTGGAIVHALTPLQNEPAVVVLNGDTFVRLDYRAMYAQHMQNQAQLTMALCDVEDTSRYGRVIMNENTITGFHEKGERGKGLINAGVYIVSTQLFAQYGLPRQFSFEKDFLFPYLNSIRPEGFITADYFIDIGVPHDYERAQKELSTWVYR